MILFWEGHNRNNAILDMEEGSLQILDRVKATAFFVYSAERCIKTSASYLF